MPETSMRSNEKRSAPSAPDDFEDIGIIKNLLELQIRLRAETDSIENPRD